VEAADDVAPRRPLAPRVIPTERTERVTPSEPAPVAVVAPDAPRRRDRVMTFGLAGVAGLAVRRPPLQPVGRSAAPSQCRPARASAARPWACSRQPRSRRAWRAPAR